MRFVQIHTHTHIYINIYVLVCSVTIPCVVDYLVERDDTFYNINMFVYEHKYRWCDIEKLRMISECCWFEWIHLAWLLNWMFFFHFNILVGHTDTTHSHEMCCLYKNMLIFVVNRVVCDGFEWLVGYEYVYEWGISQWCSEMKIVVERIWIHFRNYLSTGNHKKLKPICIKITQ